MHFVRQFAGLALLAGAAQAQVPGTPSPADSVTPQAVAFPADTIRLSRREAIAQALAHNPQLEVARAQVGQARARKVEATALPDPAGTASLDAQRRLFQSGSAGQKNVGVDMLIPFPNKLRLQGKAAQADVVSSELSYTQQRQLIAAQTSEAYDSLLVALKHRADLTEAQNLARDFLAKTQARFNAGTAAKLDVIRATVTLAQASTDLLANLLDVQTTSSALERLVGRSQSEVVVPTDTLEVPSPLPSLESVVAAGLASRPELASIQAQRAGARASTALAKQFWLPDLVLGVSRDYNQPAPALFSTGLSFPIPIFFWQHTRGQIAEASFRERELTATERDIVAAVTQDLRDSYANARVALQQAVFIRDQLLPSARAAYRAASASYSLGGSSALDVLDARRSLLDAETQYADALAAANISLAELERAVAVPLASLQTGAPNAK
ncbi:MAG TPA: TolC family protein [Gemmatimonadaceae bacterium]|nr:TolC family protein [Gemmatimonadaceae bacterium]